ncbi:MAG: aminotransferase class V-fold PLP-dependent enzyme [Bacteroidetes bacterium]|nr:aminotransferase class V-fold PLP-dependent enzyme [Bacteroidota bacterium]
MNEAYFSKFRNQIIGVEQLFPTPFGEKQIVYADWIASGRLYGPIEKVMLEKIAPFCASTHTETSITGTLMTRAYHESKEYIKRCVNANTEDALIFSGSGMTDSINKLQRILGLRIAEKSKLYIKDSTLCDECDRPIVFITHIEHHSNHTSWLETIADVEIIQPNEEGQVDLAHFATLLEMYTDRPLKIASISACSNVTGIITPYYAMAEMIHTAGGYCFVDFACSGPYVAIDMHPENPLQQLDVIFISPHKFLGGPGTPGIMVLNKKLYDNAVPDHSGGGTVKFTTPWKFHEYIDSVEDREDGGTPPFLQGIRAALCFKLKHEMGVDNIVKREEVLVETVMNGLGAVENIHILAGNLRHRIGAISFYIKDLHYNLGVKLLNDYFGIQVRGGCACAGTYGHYLLNINKEQSSTILAAIHKGELFVRPGWIRLSLHPTFTDKEVDYLIESISFIAKNFKELVQNYTYNPKKNIFECRNEQSSFQSNFITELYEVPFSS